MTHPTSPRGGAAAVRTGLLGLLGIGTAAPAAEWTLTDAQVLAAVADLNDANGEPPSTTAVVAHLSSEQRSLAALQTVVRGVLERLHHHGRVARVSAAGTHRWQL
jgi:hypothetical protein